MLSSLAVLAGCGAADSVPRCSLKPPSLATGRLRPDGVRLRDEVGRVVLLRGLNAGSRAKFAPYAPFEFQEGQFDAALAAYLDRAAGWGIDLLRVPFSWAAVEPVQGTEDANYLARYAALLDAAWRRGIRTVVDFHQDVYAENYCGDGFPAWTIELPHTPPPAPHHDCPAWFQNYETAPVRDAFDRFWAPGSTVQAGYVAMWRRMIARHRSRPGVIGFELFNEPHNGSTELSRWESTTLTDFYSAMIPMVNSLAPDSLVFFDPPGVITVLQKTDLRKPAGTNLVFAPHYYQPLTIFGGDGRPERVLDDLKAILAPRSQWNVPAFLGEWGAADSARSSFDLMNAYADAFDALELSAAQWQYSVAAERWNEEPLDLVHPDGTSFPHTGALLRPHARAVAGEPLQTSWDPTQRLFVFRYAPARGNTDVTEIAVPMGLLPEHADAAHLTVHNACVDDSVPGRLFVKPDGSAEVQIEIRGITPDPS